MYLKIGVLSAARTPVTKAIALALVDRFREHQLAIFVHGNGLISIFDWRCAVLMASASKPSVLAAVSIGSLVFS